MVEQFCILIEVVVAWNYTCDKVILNYMHILYQGQIPSFDIML
jgi:hypothetical protein